MHRLFKRKKLSFKKKSTEIFALTYLFLLLLILLNHIHTIANFQTSITPVAAEAKKVRVVSYRSSPSQFLTPYVTPSPIPTKMIVKPKPTVITTDEWGVAKQVSEHTWTMKVESDQQMGSSQDIFNALNAYRTRHGKGTLSWDEKLATYAQERAAGFSSSGKLDTHAGFNDYINNQDGFHKLGFMGLGENSSFGYVLAGVKLIEWVFAGDAPHNDNQLNSSWSHVGVGVSGSAVNLIFGGSKM